MRNAVLLLLAAASFAGALAIGCYPHNNPPPWPNDPTCPKGGPLCPCDPGDPSPDCARAKRADGGADAR